MGYAAPKTVDREPPRLFQPRILRLRNDNAPPRNATWRSSPTRSRSPIAPSTKDLSRQHWLPAAGLQTSAAEQSHRRWTARPSRSAAKASRNPHHRFPHTPRPPPDSRTEHHRTVCEEGPRPRRSHGGHPSAGRRQM